MKPRADTFWIREFEDGDWEFGILKRERYGWVMVVDRFCYFFGLDLSKWQFIGDL